MKNCFRTIVIFLFLGLFTSSALGIIPNQTYRFYPEKMGLIYKELAVVTSDSLNIKTWFFPAQVTPSEEEQNAAWMNPVKKPYTTIDEERRPTIIIANGDAGNMSYQQLFFAKYFTNAGYNVVAFDWRGFGESSDWEMDTNYLVYTELLEDYDAVVREVLKQEEVDTSKIAVFGWSTGAYLSMAISSRYENITCFVAVGLMTSFDEVVPVLKQSQGKEEHNLIVPEDYPKELQPIHLAPTYTKSTFLIVGENDDRTPVWMSEKIYPLLPGKKELWVVDGAQHHIFMDIDVWNQANERILKFLDDNLKQ